eukprot:gene6621-12157_t
MQSIENTYPVWGNRSLLEIAGDTDFKGFVAHQATQVVTSKMWNGKAALKSSPSPLPLGVTRTSIDIASAKAIEVGQKFGEQRCGAESSEEEEHHDTIPEPSAEERNFHKDLNSPRSKIRKFQQKLQILIKHLNFKKRQAYQLVKPIVESDEKLNRNIDKIVETSTRALTKRAKDGNHNGNYGRGSLVTFLSHDITNRIINIVKGFIRGTIVNEARRAGMFSVEMDTTQDITTQDQCSIVLRYVHDGDVHESKLTREWMLGNKRWKKQEDLPEGFILLVKPERFQELRTSGIPAAAIFNICNLLGSRVNKDNLPMQLESFANSFPRLAMSLPEEFDTIRWDEDGAEVDVATYKQSLERPDAFFYAFTNNEVLFAYGEAMHILSFVMMLFVVVDEKHNAHNYIIWLTFTIVTSLLVDEIRQLVRCKHFIVTSFILVVGYGVFVTSLLYPFSNLADPKVYLRIMFRPVMIFFGELGIASYDLLDSKTVFDTAKVPIAAEVVSIIGMIGFLLLTNVLLMNILIADFNNIYVEITERARMHCAFEEYELLVEFTHKPSFPFPFSLPESVYLIARRILGSYKSIDRASSYQVPEQLVKFEKYCMRKYLSKQDKKEDQDENLNRRVA